MWQEYNLLNKRAIWSIDGSIELLGQQLKKEPFVLAFAKDGGQTTSFISTSWRYYAKLREFSTIEAKPSFQSRSWGVMMLTKWVKGLNRKKRWALPLHDHDCPLQDESPQPGCSWPTPLLGLTMGGHNLLGKKINLQDVDSNRPSYWRSHTRGDTGTKNIICLRCRWHRNIKGLSCLIFIDFGKQSVWVTHHRTI